MDPVRRREIDEIVERATRPPSGRSAREWATAVLMSVFEGYEAQRRRDAQAIAELERIVRDVDRVRLEALLRERDARLEARVARERRRLS